MSEENFIDKANKYVFQQQYYLGPFLDLYEIVKNIHVNTEPDIYYEFEGVQQFDPKVWDPKIYYSEVQWYERIGFFNLLYRTELTKDMEKDLVTAWILSNESWQKMRNYIELVNITGWCCYIDHKYWNIS